MDRQRKNSLSGMQICIVPFNGCAFCSERPVTQYLGVVSKKLLGIINFQGRGAGSLDVQTDSSVHHVETWHRNNDQAG